MENDFKDNINIPDKSINYGALILRIGLAIVFAYFSINQFQNAERWVGLLPSFLKSLSNPVIFVYLNAIFDGLVAIFLIWGKFLKVISILGFIHLVSIVLFALGFTPQGFRDIGLAFAILSLFFARK